MSIVVNVLTLFEELEIQLQLVFSYFFTFPQRIWNVELIDVVF